MLPRLPGRRPARFYSSTLVFAKAVAEVRIKAQEAGMELKACGGEGSMDSGAGVHSLLELKGGVPAGGRA